MAQPDGKRQDVDYFGAGVVVPPENVAGTVGKLRGTRFTCAACGKNLIQDARIRCKECDPAIDLCVACFCQGAEPRGHVRSHAFQVLSGMAFPLFTPGWTAEEELLLLEGLTLYSFGNWPDIADHVGTKTEDECFDHYQRTYAGANFPMPLDQKVKPPPMPGKKLEIQEWCKHRKQPKKTQTSNPIKPELGGYMPLRQEFEFPFNDQAEVPVATVKFSEHDTPEEREIKMKVMQVYHKMLEERQQRSEFVVAHNLLKWKTLTKFHKSLTNDEDKKMLTRLRPVLQVTTRDKWDALVDGMLRESSLRRAIDYYGELRKEGVRTEREVEDYYARARKRGKYATRREQTLGPPPIYDGPASLSQLPLRRFTSGVLPPPAPLDPAALHNAELLGLPERTLAGDLLLTADQYLVVKEAMLREYCRAGRLSKSDAQALASVDSLSAGMIYDFLCDCKWIVASED